MIEIDPFKRDLQKSSLKLKQNEKLASYTTIGIGGNARFFVEVVNKEQLELVIKSVHMHQIPYFIIGKGSNIIISDNDYTGLAILNSTNNWQIVNKTFHFKKDNIKSRFKGFKSEYLSSSSFNDQEKKYDKVLVRAESGIRLGHLMNALFKQGITGLEWFAGIPGTIGGAIYMNIHGGDLYFGNLVYKAYLTNGKCSREVDHDYFQFDYDWSILHKTGEVILHADLCLFKGDVKKAKAFANRWMNHKSKQPQRSAGCIFQNLSEEEQERLNLPNASAGYLIEHVLELKGLRRGDAVISPNHAAFIENIGSATAKDVMELIHLVKQKAKEKLGLELKTEVKIIGEI